MADDIRQWLEELGLSKYGDVFVENGVGLDVISDLDENDLEKLGLNLGARKRLLRAAARELLQPIHAWFAEGHDTADLIAAKTLLENLR